MAHDVTAVSFHAYAYIADKYVLLPRRSIGDNYGPVLVSREPAKAADISHSSPSGTLTSAFLALRASTPTFSARSSLSTK